MFDYGQGILASRDNRDIESPSTEVEHKPPLVFAVGLDTIGDCRRDRLLKKVALMDTGKAGRPRRCFTLQRAESSGNGNDRMLEIVRGNALYVEAQRLQHFRGELFCSERLSGRRKAL